MSSKNFFFAIFFMLATCSFAQSPFEIAQEHLSKIEKYQSSDLSDIIISAEYKTQHNGVTHLYLNQRYQGIEIEDAVNNFNIKNGSVLSFGERFSTNIVNKINGLKAQLSATQALQKVMQAHNISGNVPAILSSEGTRDEETIFEKGDIAFKNIKAKLTFVKTESELRLSWEINLYEKSCQNNWETQVDAMTGEILKEYNHVIKCSFPHKAHDHAACESKVETKTKAKITLKRNAMVVANSYHVFAPPVESPNHGNRTLEISPWLDAGSAGTLGWHDDGTTEYTTTKGNNADAYEDQDATNNPTGGDAARAEGGDDLEFDFPLDLTQDPEIVPDPYITNLFYWNNLMHDVWYQYGFDEAAGNFQEDNLGQGGLGSDYVNAEAQDGSGMNNANFNTPVDGGNPRMQMFLWTPNDQNDPGLDSDLDNGVIAHEYGHGISIRLTGGPGNNGCVNNAEHMGEGWSDFLGIWMTIEPGDNHADVRGVGTYVEDQDPEDDGIRPAPYTTDMAINDYTYGDVSTVGAPHGIGFVWCTMIWEMNWALINIAGHDSNLYNGMGGNNLAARLIIDAMKMQPCDPGFVDARDAILDANAASPGGFLFNGIIWNVFARRGLGFSASQGSNASANDQVEAFDLPAGVDLLTYEELFGALPLPVELLAFRALPDNENQSIGLMWSTASESNNKGFEIQRRTEDEPVFETISWKDGQGESATIANYTFTDRNVETGETYYYRLRQLDHDGKENYSPIESASLDGLSAGIEVFPNPTQGLSTIQFSETYRGPIKMEILNAQGQVIGVQLFETNGGAEVEVDLSQQPEGVYFLKFEINGEQVVKQVVFRR